MLGIVFSILAAATFAFNAAAARRAVLSGSVIQGLMVTVPLGVPLFLILVFLTGDTSMLFSMPLEAHLWFAAAGVVHFVIGRYGNYAAGSAIGANLTSPILQCDVLIALVLAMYLLGESLTPLRAIGIILVLIGPALVANRDGTKPSTGGAAASPDLAKPAFEPRYAEGYAFAAMAAVCYGLSPILIGLGLKAAGGSGALAGGLISYLAATSAVALVLLVLRPSRTIFNLDRQALRWFLFAGTLVFFSQAFRYAALMFTPASVVTALQRLSSLFRIYASWIINPEHEVFDRSVIAATVVSMIGAMALSISTDFFLSLAPWPDWVVGLARLQWP